MRSDSPITAARAREVLDVDVLATPQDVRRAFHEAAKRAHPDRAGGAGEAFREVVAAYQRLNRPAPERIIQPPAQQATAPGVLPISALIAFHGGAVRHRLADGRLLQIKLPAGLRSGDAVRAGGAVLTVAVQGTADMLVRGSDLWITVAVDPATLAQGGRIALETPIGRRIVWVTRKAGERGLVRLVGQGLPARGSYPRGCLFIRLSARASRTDSAARTLLRRFTAAWAA
jgi:curved DNA-binding protein